ncbi:MAG: site-specific DNA-methyltransferase [candidate division Zixibacteria bacterium]|nr:site-specific DNA-methyltransferase [candidate division Zixibacteria bacterium]
MTKTQIESLTRMKIADAFNPEADAVLYHGDCLDLLKQIPSGFVTLVVTSPPYNIGKPYEKRYDLDTYLALQQEVIKECTRILADDGSLCWQVGNYVDNSQIIPLDIKIYPICESLNLKLRNRIIWHFGHGLHASKRFSGRYETILWFTKTDSYIFNLDDVRIPQKYPEKKHFKGPKRGQLSGNPIGKNPSDVWEIPNVKANHPEKTIHPCQFPVELIERLVLALTHPGDWVFDPFAGVGSTLIAALLHGRKGAGADTVKDYIDIAKNRLHLLSRGKLTLRPMGTPIYQRDSINQLKII